MKKEHLMFLLGGLAFGFLIGFGVYHAKYTAPELEASPPQAAAAVDGPRGPRAPTQSGPGSSGAPMVAEINSLKDVLQREPNNLAALVRLGNLHYDVQMWPQAVEYYERAAELDPENPDLLTDLGVCYRGLQRFDRAMELFERAYAADSNHWQSMFNVAVVAAFDLQQFDRADEALRSVEALQPQAPQVVQLREAIDRRRAEAGRVVIRRLVVLVVLALAVFWWVRRLTAALRRASAPPVEAGSAEGRSEPMVRDRVCNTFLPQSRALRLEDGETTRFFCSERCRQTFLEGRADGARPAAPSA